MAGLQSGSGFATRRPRARFPAVAAAPQAASPRRRVCLQLSMSSVYVRTVLLSGMIIGFRDADTERLWTTGRAKRLPAGLNRQALRKLYILNAALALENLSVPPGNRLEKLHGDREGQHSIRINDKYRICFVWRDGNASVVEVVDYH